MHFCSVRDTSIAFFDSADFASLLFQLRIVCVRLNSEWRWVFGFVRSCGRRRLWSRDYAAAMNIGANLRFFLNFGRWDPDFRSSADEKRLQSARAQMPAVAAVQ
jgi:hypothetical protein